MTVRNIAPVLVLALLASAPLARARDRDNSDEKDGRRATQKAIDKLQDARRYLWQAKRDYDDERGRMANQAANDVTGAITEARLALKADDGSEHASKSKDDDRDNDKVENPLSAARDALNDAKDLLRDGTKDSDDRRANATRYIDKALDRIAKAKGGTSDDHDKKGRG